MQDDKIILDDHWAFASTMPTRCSTPERLQIMSGGLPMLSDGAPDKSASFVKCVQQTISFTELPAEIRNWIYELAMPTKDHARLVVASPALDSSMVLGDQPGITRATRQTRAEALSMFYADNIFEA